MENVVRFYEWRKGTIEVLAHEAIAFRIWELLPTVGTTDIHEQSILLGKMIAAAKDIIDIEVRLENKDSDSISNIYIWILKTNLSHGRCLFMELKGN